MEKVKISPFQMFSLIFLFEIGSAVVVGLGVQAKQDAWIAILIGMLGGIVLFCIYYCLFRQYPDLPLTSYIPKVLGKMIGYPVAVFYILYFIYIASRVLRDLGNLLFVSTLTQTPLWVINLLVIFIIIYANYLGIEPLARTGEIFYFLLIFCVLMCSFFIFSSGLAKTENLLPLLENGWKPVIKTAFPLTFTFPFGEMIVFTILMPYLNRPHLNLKTGLFAMLLSGLILSYTTALNIAVLGTQKLETSIFPLLETVSKVNLGDFLQRLDAIVISMLVIGCFFKISVFTYAAVIGSASLFKKRKNPAMVIVVCLLTLVASLLNAENIQEHIYIGLKIVPVYLHLPFQAGIPLLLLIIMLIRKKNKTR
ncbi:GerAB/ArcD/ProY family transporter [Metabacillus idriensis]|uniref:GerAB/ArcD/ProY family transporter n=1 Tax=Metabacillus idriensis TaxID=324768 RepID=UPI00174A7936|nr:GerAB/ArcD/ProY family transporter [Metabacillus idriensis]